MSSDSTAEQDHLIENKLEVAATTAKKRVRKRQHRTPMSSILHTDALTDIVKGIAKDVISGMLPQRIEVVTTGGTKVKELEDLTPECFEQVVKLASLRRNIMLVGPAGCGKTYLAALIAKALDLSFSSISCTAGMSESQLLGWLLPTGEAGRFEYRPAPFITAYENGGVYLLDELDCGDSNTVMILNQALSGDQFTIPQRLENPVVKRHKDFVCIAACNTYGQGADMLYVGRNQLDAATLDRFTANTIAMDYSPAIEEALVDPAVLAWGRKIRAKIKECGLRRILSTRVMIDFTLHTDNYSTAKEDWEDIYFRNWTEEEIARVKDVEDNSTQEN